MVTPDPEALRRRLLAGFPADIEAGFGSIIEGRCPIHDAPLELRPLDLRTANEPASAGWCDTCRAGWTATTHRHDEYCAGPNLDEAHLWCVHESGEHTITRHDPIAFGDRTATT